MPTCRNRYAHSAPERKGQEVILSEAKNLFHYQYVRDSPASSQRELVPELTPGEFAVWNDDLLDRFVVLRCTGRVGT